MTDPEDYMPHAGSDAVVRPPKSKMPKPEPTAEKPSEEALELLESIAADYVVYKNRALRRLDALLDAERERDVLARKYAVLESWLRDWKAAAEAAELRNVDEINKETARQLAAERRAQNATAARGLEAEDGDELAFDLILPEIRAAEDAARAEERRRTLREAAARAEQHKCGSIACVVDSILALADAPEET